MEGIKKRTSNFNEGEEKVLIDLVKKYQHIVENKKTDAVTNEQKLNAWIEISREFNSICGGCKSFQTLKTKFKNLKKNTKSKVASERRGIRGIGGGPPLPETPLTPSEKQLREIMGRTLTGFPSRFGGDESAIHDDRIPVRFEYNDEYTFLPEKEDETTEEGNYVEIMIVDTDRNPEVSGATDLAPFRVEENFHVTPAKVTESEEYPINEMPNTSGFPHLKSSCSKKNLYMNPAREQEARVNGMPSTSELIHQTTSHAKKKLFMTPEKQQEFRATERPSTSGLILERTSHAKENEASSSKDWSNYTPAKLREKKAKELTLPRENVRDKISAWALSKAELVEAQKEALKEEHKKKMEHMQELHDMQMTIMQEEWDLKKAQMKELHEKKLSEFK